jgi:D-glycero-D-manno-heptose 1,7-bisphosphate phosphatase
MIDLDGTIIGTPDEEKGIAGLRLFLEYEWHVAVVTNQPPRLHATDMEHVNAILFSWLGVELPWYICSHGRDDGCSCRKPEPGLLLKAMHDLDVPCVRSWMIGDKWSDMLAGQRAAVGTCLVEEFGYKQKGETPMQKTDPPDLFCKDLQDAAKVLTCLMSDEGVDQR